jgi:tetratricopeptide (TPR) repeat protein
MMENPFYLIGGKLQTARELGNQLLSLAQRLQDRTFLVAGYQAPGSTFYFMGKFALAREYMEQALTFYDPPQNPSYGIGAVGDRGMVCLSYAAGALWYLGYPDQALAKSHEALTLARRLSHPFSSVYARFWAAHFTGTAKKSGQLRKEQKR